MAESCDSPTIEALCAYYELLSKWNRRINLTGFELDVPSRLAIDRLFVEPVIASNRLRVSTQTSSVVDIGSGGGSPAIPMALSWPGLQVTMVESRSRKAVFLREAVRGLGVRASVEDRRVEDLAADPRFGARFQGASMRAVQIGRAHV